MGGCQVEPNNCADVLVALLSTVAISCRAAQPGHRPPVVRNRVDHTAVQEVNLLIHRLGLGTSHFIALSLSTL